MLQEYFEYFFPPWRYSRWVLREIVQHLTGICLSDLSGMLYDRSVANTIDACTG